jgi:hypothetical protein
MHGQNLMQVLLTGNKEIDWVKNGQTRAALPDRAYWQGGGAPPPGVIHGTAPIKKPRIASGL